MSVKATGPPRRGKRSPTAVWILARRGKLGTTYRIRWADQASGKTLSEACGRDLALARQARDRKKAELRGGLSGRLPDRMISDLMAELPAFMAGKCPVGDLVVAVARLRQPFFGQHIHISGNVRVRPGNGAPFNFIPQGRSLLDGEGVHRNMRWL